MDELERMTFKVKTDDGKEIECEVLFTFESEETNKNYMVYTDNTTDEEGNTKVYAAIYTPGEETQTLQPVESEAEWDVIQKILDEVMAEAQKEGQE